MANVNIRVDETVKKAAEGIFSELGLSMSAATNIFYRQVVRTGGVPFELKIHSGHPLDMSKMTKEEFDAEIQKGYDDIRAGRVVPHEEIKRKYGV